jgi:hypothetical protein
MNVDACTSLPITTAMSRLDLGIGVSLPGPLRRAGLMRVIGSAAGSGRLGSGSRRRVSTCGPGLVWKPYWEIVPLRVAGRVDRCWDVVPACWREHSFIRSLMVLPRLPVSDWLCGGSRRCSCWLGMTGLKIITMSS